MAQVSDTIAATVTLKGDAAIRDLTTLARKAKETDRAFNETGRSAQYAGARLADGTSRAGTAAIRSTGAFKDLVSRRSAGVIVDRRLRVGGRDGRHGYRRPVRLRQRRVEAERAGQRFPGDVR